MKKIIVWLMFLILGLQNFANNPLSPINQSYSKVLINESSLSMTNATDYDLSIMNLQVDALGILFYGPQLALDFQFANMIAVGPFFRWHYAGVIYQGIVTNWFSNEVTTSPASYSIGGQAKFLIPIGSGQHRPYFEIGFEKSFGSDSYDPGGTWGRHIYEYESNIFHINAGYRLLTAGRFNLSTAVGIGFLKKTKNIGYYEYGDSGVEYYPLDSGVSPMLQLILGWQLGS